MKWRGREGRNERERERQLRCGKERGILTERNEEMGRRQKKGRRGKKRGRGSGRGGGRREVEEENGEEDLVTGVDDCEGLKRGTQREGK